MAEFLFKGTKICYESAGKGPAIVLLHGFLETSSMWNFAWQKLGINRRYIRIDLPGHGGSECLGYTHHMEEMAELVNSVLLELKVRRCQIIGHSMGGYIALAFGELYPDKVSKLTLLNSTARADSVEKKANRLRAINVLKTQHKTFVRNSIPLLFRSKNRKVFREEINQLKSEALTMESHAIAAALRGMRERPSREIILKFAPFETTFIYGDKDPVIDVQSIEEQIKIDEKVSGICLKGSGHMSWVEDETNCLKEIKQTIK